MVFFAFDENSIQLVPDLTLLLHVLIVLLMVWVVNRTLLRPVNRILEEREALTSGRLTEAEKTIAKVRDMVANYEHQLRQTRAEGYRLMEQERLAALREREEKVAVTKDEVAGLVTQEKQALSEQVSSFRENLASEARRISLEISARILHRPIESDIETSRS